MKIYNVTNCITTFNGKKPSFVQDIKDRNTEQFEKLQKNKIETLLKYRETCAVIDRYEKILKNAQDLEIKIKLTLHKDLGDMLKYKSLLYNRLHEINLEILAEEEKNY